MSGADPKRRFGIPLKVKLTPEIKGALDRGIENEWFRLVDIALVTSGSLEGEIVRWFRLTDAGMARLSRAKESRPRN